MPKVIFAQNIWHEQLGIGYLAASLKRRGIESVLLVGHDVGRLLPRILEEKPTLVAFSATTGADRWALRLARSIKQAAPIPIVMGGAHPTFYPDVLVDEGLDAIVRGEGEEAICELVEALDGGRDMAGIRNLCTKKNGVIRRNDPRPLIADLDQIPFPDRDLFDRHPMFRRDAVRPVLTGRGCPYDCSYCFNASYRDLYAGKGKTVRLRSVENCLAEVKLLTGRYRLRLINFVDDIFGLNRRWLKEFLTQYKREVAVPFLCNTRWELVDEDMAHALKDANCWSLQLGLESGHERMRTQILRGGASNTRIEAKARLLKRYGLRFRTYNMVGIPGESLEDAFQTARLNAEIGTDFPYVAIYQPYPGTSLGERALHNGAVYEGGPGTLPATFHKRSVLDQAEIRKIENLHKLFLLAVRFIGLKPILKWMVSLPANPLFELIFLLSTGVTYARLTRRRLWDVFRIGWLNLRYYLEI